MVPLSAMLPGGLKSIIIGPSLERDYFGYEVGENEVEKLLAFT